MTRPYGGSPGAPPLVGRREVVACPSGSRVFHAGTRLVTICGTTTDALPFYHASGEQLSGIKH